jgi:hypothetical protein
MMWCAMHGGGGAVECLKMLAKNRVFSSPRAFLPLQFLSVDFHNRDPALKSALNLAVMPYPPVWTQKCSAWWKSPRGSSSVHQLLHTLISRSISCRSNSATTALKLHARSISGSDAVYTTPEHWCKQWSFQLSAKHDCILVENNMGFS